MSDLLTTLGWREWVSLPDLGIDRLAAKVDTGAKTSALDATAISEIEQDGMSFVRFTVDAGSKGLQQQHECTAQVVDQREVRDSGGHVELRYVIRTEVVVDGLRWAVEMTLAERSSMKYPMLLGRQALRGRFVVDPQRSFYAPKQLMHSPGSSNIEGVDALSDWDSAYDEEE